MRSLYGLDKVTRRVSLGISTVFVSMFFFGLKGSIWLAEDPALEVAAFSVIPAVLGRSVVSS